MRYHVKILQVDRTNMDWHSMSLTRPVHQIRALNLCVPRSYIEVNSTPTQRLTVGTGARRLQKQRVDLPEGSRCLPNSLAPVSQCGASRTQFASMHDERERKLSPSLCPVRLPRLSWLCHHNRELPSADLSFGSGTDIRDPWCTWQTRSTVGPRSARGLNTPPLRTNPPAT